MHILLAFDKFKDSMNAFEACAIAQEALLKAHPNWEVTVAPLADGGEGFCRILTRALYGELITKPIIGPQLEPLKAEMGYVDSAKVPPSVKKMLGLPSFGKIAIIEMAQASGLESIPIKARDPWIATSYGTGQLIAEAADTGASAIILGVGGSATIDLGLGALEAIGLECLDEKHDTMDHLVPRDWPRISRLRGEIWPHIPPIFIACDVQNPLLGPNGAVNIYGPQKGLTPSEIPTFEKGLGDMAKKFCSFFGKDRTEMMRPGSGAAGGITFGLSVACDAQLVPGYDLVEAWLDLKKKIAAADLVVTGEGRFDSSSLQGKGPGSILKEAARQGKPAKVMAGIIESGLKLPPKATGDVIAPSNYTRERSIADGKKLLAKKIFEVFSQ
ncbi:glycerate kinase [Cerasicoccus arenae]|uniref:Glycerate kinase n=1 Tax=Cerasicoccus arenae TaxID=424488 RepID=A0A8J3DE65_9BACT|nr:glycerate kinase [Cerasicoccus arenae]MBK1856972.1 glycerate kinase [Cerasicoccus arenae]GHB90147.1 glycerate kinase [Cerasicoccus arenae]